MPRKKSSDESELSRRERQLMDAIYARGEATAAEVQAALPDAPSYSAIRALLRILEEKGHLKHREDAGRYVYLSTRPRAQASRSALRRLVDTFFGGSVAKAAAALVDSADGKLSPEELAELEALIRKARKP